MTSHELAAKLLTCPDLPIALYANGHTYMAGLDGCTHGSVKIGLLKTYAGDHVIVGNFHKLDLNAPNWWVERLFVWASEHP